MSLPEFASRLVRPRPRSSRSHRRVPNPPTNPSVHPEMLDPEALNPEPSTLNPTTNEAADHEQVR